MMKKKRKGLQRQFRLGSTLARYNFKLRHEGSYLGLVWYFLEPFLLFLILLYIHQFIASASIAFYPVYLLLGLVMFNFFSHTTMQAVNVIRENRQYIKTMRIPKEPFVLGVVIQNIYTHIFEITIVCVIAIIIGVSWQTLLLYPLVFVPFIVFTTGVAFALATIGVYIGDLNNVWRVFITMLWFATPLFYVVEKAQAQLFSINPLYQYVTIARDIMVYHTLPTTMTLLLAALFTILAPLIGILLFNIYKSRFSEVV